jgi:hypothetical protein
LETDERRREGVGCACCCKGEPSGEPDEREPRSEPDEECMDCSCESRSDLVDEYDGDSV